MCVAQGFGGGVLLKGLGCVCCSRVWGVCVALGFGGCVAQGFGVCVLLKGLGGGGVYART